MNLIIGLIGAKQAGKTTAYNTMAEHTVVQEITLAAKLKDVCAQHLGISRDAFDEPELKERDFTSPVFLTATMIADLFSAYDHKPDYDQFIRHHIGKILYTPRQVAQYIGTEVLRKVEPSIHCRAAAEALECNIGVVTDIRFQNEYDYFQTHAKYFVPVYIKNVAAEIEAAKDGHSSEAHLQALAKRAVITIVNDRDLLTFQDRVKLNFKNITAGRLD